MPHETNDSGKPSAKAADQANEEPVTFANFLTQCHPSIKKLVSDLWSQDNTSSRAKTINTPVIRLYCSSDKCSGIRNFRCHDEVKSYGSTNYFNAGIRYVCSDCHAEPKFYSLHVEFKDAPFGEVIKFGEVPPFGPPIPQHLLCIFGSDSRIFLQGRSCENQAFGIGAFAYYRRVVENHKNQLFDEIIKVCKLIGRDDEFVTQLAEAKELISFSAAVEHIKATLPDALLIDGHNPLTLLHSALSRGLHDDSDQECLAIAHSIRVVLAALTERIAQLKKDDRELADAVKRLLAAKP